MKVMLFPVIYYTHYPPPEYNFTETLSKLTIKISQITRRSKKFFVYKFFTNMLNIFPDWSNLPDDIGAALLKWLYTDVVDLSRGESFALQLMKSAASFKLHGLVGKCEQALIATVGVR